VRAVRRYRDAGSGISHDGSPSTALVIVIISGVAALIFGGALISLAREDLHIGCSMGSPGSEGGNTWLCRDGIGYLGFAATGGVMWLGATLSGAVVAGNMRRGCVARRVLVVLATVSALWIVGVTWHGATQLVGDQFSPLTGAQYWSLAAGPAAAAVAISLVIAVVGAATRGRVAVIGCVAASLGLVVSTVLQPGLSLGTIPAAGLLAAAALRSPVDPR
jgi:hypothetical protein